MISSARLAKLVRHRRRFASSFSVMMQKEIFTSARTTSVFYNIALRNAVSNFSQYHFRRQHFEAFDFAALGYRAMLLPARHTFPILLHDGDGTVFLNFPGTRIGSRRFPTIRPGTPIMNKR